MDKENILNTIVFILLIIITISVVYGNFNRNNENTGANSYARCETTTETAVSIGPSNSVTVLSAKSGRSWARVQLSLQANGVSTSTPSIAFGSTATLANGIQLSTTTPYIEFGMDTDHAYSGIVTAINTGSASTTLRVSECR